MGGLTWDDEVVSFVKGLWRSRGLPWFWTVHLAVGIETAATAAALEEDWDGFCIPTEQSTLQ